MKSSNSDNDTPQIRVGRAAGDSWCKRISDDHTIEITQKLGRVANRERGNCDISDITIANPRTGTSLRLPPRDRVMIRTLSTRPSLTSQERPTAPRSGAWIKTLERRKCWQERRKRVEKCTSSEEIREAKSKAGRRGTRRGLGFLRPEANNNIRGFPAEA